MSARLHFGDLVFHHTAGVVHIVGVDEHADADSVAAVVQAEFARCHAWALVIEVPETAPFAPSDIVRVAEALNRHGDSWKIFIEVEDPRDLARLWHDDGHEVRVTRP